MPKLNALVALALLSLPAAAQLEAPNGMRKGSWRTKDVPEGWKVWNLGRYEFQSNAPEAKVVQVGKHLNAMYDLYAKTFPAGRTPSKPFVVKIFKSRKEFLDYGAPPGAGAYYSWVDKEMVGFDTGKIDGVVDAPAGGTTGKKEGAPVQDLMRRLEAAQRMDLLGVFAHEGWHQYFHWWCTSKIAFPAWCDEGIGEYFYTARIRQGKTEAGAPNDYRLGTIQAAIRRGKHIPLKDLVTFDQRKYYAQAGLCYAEGWSLCHFFLEHPAYKKQRYLNRFVQVFVAEHSIEEAIEQVFGRMDWEKTEADWKAWVLALKAPGAVSEDDIEAALEKLMGGEAEGRPAGEGGGERPAGGPGGAPPAREGGGGQPPGEGGARAPGPNPGSAACCTSRPGGGSWFPIDHHDLLTPR